MKCFRYVKNRENSFVLCLARELQLFLAFAGFSRKHFFRQTDQQTSSFGFQKLLVPP